MADRSPSMLGQRSGRPVPEKEPAVRRRSAIVRSCTVSCRRVESGRSSRTSDTSVALRDSPGGFVNNPHHTVRIESGAVVGGIMTRKGEFPV